MTAAIALRYIVWACALAGALIVFAWPFLVSPDPESPLLMTLSRALVVVLLLALVVAAVLRARRPP
jgi:hypothetical protein